MLSKVVEIRLEPKYVSLKPLENPSLYSDFTFAICLGSFWSSPESRQSCALGLLGLDVNGHQEGILSPNPPPSDYPTALEERGDGQREENQRNPARLHPDSSEPRKQCSAY